MDEVFDFSAVAVIIVINVFLCCIGVATFPNVVISPFTRAGQCRGVKLKMKPFTATFASHRSFRLCHIFTTNGAVPGLGSEFGFDVGFE